MFINMTNIWALEIMKSLSTNAAIVALDVQIQIVLMNISLQIQNNIASNSASETTLLKQTFPLQFTEGKI